MPGRKIGVTYGVHRRVAKATLAFLSGWLLALAGPAAAQAPPAKATPPRPQLILALGDSLTAGYGLKPGEDFPARLEAALRREGRQVKVHNAGVSGDTSAQGRARLDWVLAGLKQTPDVAIVALGANDMLQGRPVAPMRANLDAIVAELDRRGVKVVVAGMLAAPNLGRAYASDYNGSFAALAKARGAFYYPFFMEGVAANPKLLLADGMHPNPAGVDVMVTGILPVVRRALDAPPRR